MSSEVAFAKLLDFLDDLNAGGIHYQMRYGMPRMIGLDIALPSARWEIDFGEDREVLIEKFISHGVVGPDGDLWDELERDIGECIAERGRNRETS